MSRAVKVLKAVSLLAVPVWLLGISAAVSAADLVETLRADGRFSQLVRAIEAAELADTLRGPDAFTVFAPTDEAFAGRPSGELRDVLAGDPERLRTLLRHHIVEGRRPSNDLPPELPSLAGEPLAVEFGAGGLTAADGDQRATVVAGDIEADNGLIHAIDQVLVPSTLTQPPSEVAAQPRQEEDAAAPAAGPEVAIGQPGQEAAVEVAAGQDGTRQVEARVTTEQPAQPEPTVSVAPPSSDPTAPAPAAEAEAAAAAQDAEPQGQAQRPQAEAPEAQQPVAAQQPRLEQQQQQQQQQPQPAQGQQQQQAMAPQPERAEPQQPRREQQPVQQARLTEEEPAPADEAREAPPAAALTSLETLSDRTVRSSDGEVEGRVADLIFSRETGEIELVVVEYGGFLGLGRKTVAVPWQEVRFDNEAEQLIIDMSRAELQEAPEFDYDALDTERYAQYRR